MKELAGGTVQNRKVCFRGQVSAEWPTWKTAAPVIGVPGGWAGEHMLKLYPELRF